MKTRFLLCMVVGTVAVKAEDLIRPPPGTGRDALEIVQRSLPFVKEKGVAWIEDRQCASCHQVPSMLWSLNRAARQGLDVDRRQVTEWTTWAADWRHWNQSGDKDGVDKVSAGNIDTMVFLLLGRDAGADKEQPWTQDYRTQLLKNQQKDGSWKPGGQLPLTKRPVREMSEVTTMWALLALNPYDADPSVSGATRRAGEFLATAQPGKSTEWHAVRLLLQPDLESLREAVLKLQHADGGWGWLAGEPGDALGTGLALYALASSGLPTAHDAAQRAIGFLKRTQKPDGSWAVPSTRARDKNKVIPTATYWGTAWATIALLELSQAPAR